MSERFFVKSIVAPVVANVLMSVTLVGPMLLAAAGVAVLAALVGAGPQWPWFIWIVVAPLVYLSWVTLYLAICALTTRQMGKRYPKPRHLVLRPWPGFFPEGLRILTVMTCYGVLNIIEELPLARVTGWIPCLSTLWMRAYSPALHFGTNVSNSGNILDPDLTEIGDNTVIGRRATLSAHAIVPRADGITLVFTSAPIKIGHRVTLGGGTSVGMGCVIGDDAVIEPLSVLAPFTRIPAGEVWGGHPAAFIRKRMGFTWLGLDTVNDESVKATLAGE
jgi:hypothetical protein